MSRSHHCCRVSGVFPAQKPDDLCDRLGECVAGECGDIRGIDEAVLFATSKPSTSQTALIVATDLSTVHYGHVGDQAVLKAANSTQSSQKKRNQIKSPPAEPPRDKIPLEYLASADVTSRQSRCKEREPPSACYRPDTRVPAQRNASSVAGMCLGWYTEQQTDICSCA